MRYESAAAVLPGNLRRAALALTTDDRRQAEEIRLRSGQEMTVIVAGCERSCGVTVEQEDLEALCNLVTEFSRYAAVETLRHGYLTIRGGCRVGFCGTAVMKDGVVANLKDFSSAVIRIAREKHGIAEGLPEQLFRDGCFLNTLILAPPGGGKTTLLRELVRCLSNGCDGKDGLRVALVDERGEIPSAVHPAAQPQSLPAHPPTQSAVRRSRHIRSTNSVPVHAAAWFFRLRGVQGSACS